ncbi:MAG: YkgJ family cysteine cluster protein [Peptococcaceae bacterium]|nr:YkgJ family cysteine cluster protein [Peptococcaceae bacterium]
MIKPTEVKTNAQRLEEQNYKFRTFLKSRADDEELDMQFLDLHKKLFENYDCCKCANCCKTYDIILADDEVKRIAAFLKITEDDFAAEYLTNTDADDERPYKFKNNPCAFLGGGGRCRIQDCKPDVCAGFPFTDQPERLASMYSVIEHAEVCPVVFEILERLKVMYGFRNRR